MIVCVLVFCIDIIFVQQFLCIFLYFFLQPVCLPVCLSPSLARRVKCDDQFGRCHKVWMLNCSIQSNDLKKFGKRKRDAQMTIGERKEKKKMPEDELREKNVGDGGGGRGGGQRREERLARTSVARCIIKVLITTTTKDSASLQTFSSLLER